MVGFLSPLKTILLDETANNGRGQWVLADDLIYESEIIAGHIVVPAGFQTDFASVPRLPVVFLVTGDTAHEPAVLHDYLYSSAAYPRHTADDVFREAMIAVGVPPLRRMLLYFGVRVFGGAHFARG